MDSNISSKKIGNPLLVEVLKELTVCFNSIGQTFFVIGATALDMIFKQLADVTSRRRTIDLDVAIAIPCWPAFDKITETLLASGFEKGPEKQQFFYKGHSVDIVPYGELAKDDDCIYWPPDETIAMSVKGFDEVLADAITVRVDDDFDLKIASLPGLFLLKFNAWEDRHWKTNKDAGDMSFILSNYYLANMSRDFHPEVYDLGGDLYLMGAYWLAWDLMTLLKENQLEYYRARIKEELEKKESSPLINQILESDSSLKYEQVRIAWDQMANVFKNGIENEYSADKGV